MLKLVSKPLDILVHMVYNVYINKEMDMSQYTINPSEIQAATNAFQKEQTITMLGTLIYFFAPNSMCIGRVTRYIDTEYAVVEYVARASEIDGTAYSNSFDDAEYMGTWAVLLPSLIADRTRMDATRRRDTEGRE